MMLRHAISDEHRLFSSQFHHLSYLVCVIGSGEHGGHHANNHGHNRGEAYACAHRRVPLIASSAWQSASGAAAAAPPTPASAQASRIRVILVTANAVALGSHRRHHGASR